MEDQWQLLIDGIEDEFSLYQTLTDLLIASQSCPISTFFPPAAPQIILDLLDSPHEPQVLLIACVLVGCLCNVTSTSKQQLAQRGVLSSLSSVLQRATIAFHPSTPSSSCNQLLSMLAEYVSTMLVYFSLGPNICIYKLLRSDTLSIIVSLVDPNAIGMFASGDNAARDTLTSLAADGPLIGQRVAMSIPIASIIYDRLIGCDTASTALGPWTIGGEPYVLSLYDTSGDEDICIADELTKRCGEDCVWRSTDDIEIDGDMDNAEWVDVKVADVIDGTYFWAVVGADDIESLDRMCDRLKTAAENATALDTEPFPGQIVLVKSTLVGWYRARVVKVYDSHHLRVFAIDHGFKEDVDTSQLYTLDANKDDVLSSPPPLIHLCKLMGMCTELQCYNQ